MKVSNYWVGQIPSQPLTINVYDSIGNFANLSAYDNFEIVLLGSDNEEVDLTGSELLTSGAGAGSLVLTWPEDRSVFNKHGEYVLQLKLTSGTKMDFTTMHHIKVRELGRVG